MPHFNADKTRSLHEKLSFTLQGVRYDCRDLTDAVLRDIEALSDDSLEGEGLSSALAGQLAVLTGEDASVFLEAAEGYQEPPSVREMSGILDWIQEVITDPRGRKNARSAPRR